MNVSGKKAIVFGGTSGIGLATSLMLVAGGASVIAVSRNPEKAGDVPAGITLEKGDVLDRQALSELFEKHTGFDILVSAATGGGRAIGPFLDMELDGYQSSFDKLWGYTNVVRLGTAHMSENGAIVLVSGAPARKCKPGQIALSSVGGAVEAFVRGLAPEIAPRRINVMSPGSIETPMFGEKSPERDALFEKITADNIIKRAGSPQEAAKGIMFLIENNFVTGTTLDVDGGWISA